MEDLGLEQEDQDAVPRVSDQADQQRGYDVVHEQLQHQLLAGTQFKKEHREPVRKIIELRRAAAEALGQSDAVGVDRCLSELETILPALPKVDPAHTRELSDQLDRAVAWYNGDMAATVPPALPDPKKPKKALVADRPTAKGKEKPDSGASENALPDTDAPHPWQGRWLRRVAAMVLLAIVISGLRAPDRRADLADALALYGLSDVRSFEEAQLWFQRARWIDAAMQSLGFATTDALALGESAVERMVSLTADGDDPVPVAETIESPPKDAPEEAAVAALAEQQRLTEEVDQHAVAVPKNDVP